jgi:hypothetical protein
MAIRKQCSQHIFELLYNYMCRHHSSSTGYIFNFQYVLFMNNIYVFKLLKALYKEEKTGSIATSIDRSRFKPRESERRKGNVVFVPVKTFSNYGAGIFKKSMGARYRVGIGLSYRPARQLAELIPWNRFLGSINV